MIILDGAADRKNKELENMTPLEFAKTPVLDTLAKKGRQSMIDIIGGNITPESDSGTLALLSYDPKKYYPGRGTLEGIGAGMPEGYIHSASFRINFASYCSDKGTLDRRTARGLSDDELQSLREELCKKIKLDENVGFKLIVFGHHRGILSLVSNEIELSGNVSNTDPGFEKKGNFSIPVKKYENRRKECIALDDSQAAKNTAYYINWFSQQAELVLQESVINKKRIEQGMMAANCILVRDGGRNPVDLPSFYDKFQWSLVMYGQIPAEKAIAELIGGEFQYTKALELQLDDDYLINIARVFTENPCDVNYIHLKGPDEPGHDRDPYGKVKAIEKIDYFFMREFVKHIKNNDIVVVTCDHATPCDLGIHSDDKVPVLISSNSIIPDGQSRFTEKNAMNGGADIGKAVDLLIHIKHYIINEDNYEE